MDAIKQRYGMAKHQCGKSADQDSATKEFDAVLTIVDMRGVFYIVALMYGCDAFLLILESVARLGHQVARLMRKWKNTE